MRAGRLATLLFLAATAGADGGGYLPGAEDAPAARAVEDRPSPGVPDPEILFDESGRPFVSTTHFLVVLKPGATVGQVNAALRRFNARITGMARGQNVLEIRVPDPGRRRTLRDVENLAAALARLPPFKDALPFSFQNPE